MLLGFVAQALFTMRFLVQWIASERAGHSVIPLAFWIFSIGGGMLLLVYALYRKDPVFIAGQASASSSICATSISSCASASRLHPPRDRVYAVSCGGKRGEAAFEIGDEVLDRFEADMEAHRRTAGLPACRGAYRRAVERNGEALIAAPRSADAEQFELVEEGEHRLLRHRLEHHAEQPEAPVKSRFQMAWPG